jgi:propionyl-CoA carboxylase alpha chain
MRVALDEYVIRGLKHNVCLLRDIICQERYIAGELTTNYLTEEYKGGFKKAAVSADQAKRLVAGAAVLRLMREINQSSVNKCGPVARRVERELSVCLSKGEEKDTPITVALSGTVGDAHADVEVKLDGEAAFTMTVEWQVGFPVVKVKTSTQQDTFNDVMQYWGTNERTLEVQFLGTVFGVNVLTPEERAVWDYMPVSKNTKLAKFMLSPMPGVVVGINVKEGDKVTAGTEILTLEAMKMRNKLRAEVDGVIKTIKVEVGKTVEDSAVLVEFE